MIRQKTIEELKSIIIAKNLSLKFIGNDSKRRLLFFCTKHKEETKPIGLHPFKKGRNPCKKCNNENGINDTAFISDELNKKRTSEAHSNLEFLYRDKSNNEKAFFKCKKHGKINESKLIYDVCSPNGNKSNPCKKCLSEKKQKPRKITRDYIQHQLNLLGGNTLFIDFDKKNSKRGVFLCKHHGIIPDSRTIYNTIRKKNPSNPCKECNKSKHSTKRTNEEIQSISDSVFGHFIFLRRDKENTSYGFFFCKNHPTYGEIHQNIDNHLKGSNPCCFEKSKNEKEIRNFLSSEKIVFSQNKKFKGCYFKNQLSYDFYLPKFNLLIEYDGVQHYKRVNRFQKSEKDFELQKRKDLIKNLYAKKEEFNLLRIPYFLNKQKEDILNSVIRRIKENSSVFEVDLTKKYKI